MRINYKIQPDKFYIVAVSFGPDSMCLLDLLRKEKCQLVVAHVNYHKRPESNQEQIDLEKYCKNNNLKFEVLDTKDLKPIGNFQKWAREIRYEFFALLQEKYNAECVFVAHQQDDLIETYLMQKNKGNYVKYWGIAKKNTVKHAQIVRPLLNYSKAELQRYCDENRVPYAIDSSNLEDHYTRNKIRHAVMEKINDDERQKLLAEINTLNINKQESNTTHASIKEFVEMNYEGVVGIISTFLHQQNEHIDLSRDFVGSLQKSFKSTKSNITIPLTKNVVISKEYDEVYLISKSKEISYLYKLEKNEVINDELFEIDLRNFPHERNITLEMFPLTIKPIKKNEKYIVSDYLCEVRRLFIDWKVPPHLRNCWPGIYDKDGNLVYVPRYKKEYTDAHKTKFIIKFTK